MSLLNGKPVIVPWDFSDMSQEALGKALGLTKDADLIHVVHVTQLPPVMEPGVVWGSLDEGSIIKHCEDSFQTVLKSKPEWEEFTSRSWSVTLVCRSPTTPKTTAPN